MIDRMTVCAWKLVAGAAIAAGLLAGGVGCESKTPPDPTPAVAPPADAGERARLTAAIPTVDLDGVDPRVVERIATDRAAVEAEPTRATAWGDLGLTFHAHGWIAQAATCYERALTLDGAHEQAARWRYHQARALNEIGELDRALAAFEAAGPLDPTYAPIRWRRGDLLLELGQSAAALAAYQAALQADPQDPGAMTGLARALIQLERYEEAAAILEQLATAYPSVRYLDFLLGGAYRSLGRFQDAAPRLAKAAGMQSPSWPDPWSEVLLDRRAGLGAVMKEVDRLRARGEIDAALEALETLREERPDERIVLSKLAETYLSAGRTDAGYRVAKRAAELYPGDFVTQLNLGYAHELRNEPSKALAAYGRVIRINPGLAAAHYQRARVLIGQNEYEPAADALRRAIELGFPNPAARLNLGQVLLQLERWEEAGLAFNQLVARQPENATAHGGLALALIELGRFQEARDVAMRGVRLNKDDPYVRAAAAQITQRQGQGQ